MYPTTSTPGYAQQRASQAYQTAAETVTPAAAIVMLYDGAIRKVSEAKRAISENRIEERFICVTKAYRIINGLHCHLDFESGGDIAQLLDQYYSYILHRLTEINVKNDPAICDEIIDRLREMRSSWSQIAEGNPDTPIENQNTETPTNTVSA